MSSTLKLKIMNPELDDLYKNHQQFHEGDSGFDLYVPDTITIKMGETKFIDLEIKAEMIESGENISYQLFPRSSISKTPLILANSVGVIDAGYRGNLIAAVKYVPSTTDLQNMVEFISNPSDTEYVLPSFTIEKHKRLFQICKFDGKSFNHEIVESLSNTTRLNGGFGSTGS